MDARRLALGFAVARVAVGAAFVLAPDRVGQPWVGPPAGTPAGRLMGRSLGIRDLLLGAGLWRALDGGGDAAAWLRYGALADAVDGAAAALAFEHLPMPGRCTVPFALGTSVVGLAMARSVA